MSVNSFSDFERLIEVPPVNEYILAVMKKSMINTYATPFLLGILYTFV
jgi:hypothetical protein